MFLFLLGYAYRISTAGFVDKIYFNIYLYCSDKCEGTYYKVGTVRVTQTDSDDWNNCVKTSSLYKYDQDHEYLRVCPPPLPDPTRTIPEQTPQDTPSLTLQATPEVTPWETPNKTPLYTLEMTPQITPNMTQILVVLPPTPSPTVITIIIERPQPFNIFYLVVPCIMILLLLAIIIILACQIKKQNEPKHEDSSSSVEVADVMLPQMIKDLHTIMVSNDPFQSDFDSSEPFALSEVLPH